MGGSAFSRLAVCCVGLTCVSGFQKDYTPTYIKQTCPKAGCAMLLTHIPHIAFVVGQQQMLTHTG